MDLLRRSGVGRDINRHYYTRKEIDEHLTRPVVRSLQDLIRFRNAHAGFAGDFHLLPCDDHAIAMEWRNRGDWARLEVDFRALSGNITYSTEAGNRRFRVAPGERVEVVR
jgi:sucrose phosphorylase